MIVSSDEGLGRADTVASARAILSNSVQQCCSLRRCFRHCRTSLCSPSQTARLVGRLRLAGRVELKVVQPNAPEGAAMPDGKISRVGVIGLGKMGLPMSRHLIRHGFSVMGYD